jgi:hypothetical protein
MDITLERRAVRVWHDGLLADRDSSRAARVS